MPYDFRSPQQFRSIGESFIWKLARRKDKREVLSDFMPSELHLHLVFEDEKLKWPDEKLVKQKIALKNITGL